MQKVEQTKAFYYFDEAGNTDLLGRHGVNLVEQGVASKFFMVGYLETKNPKELRRALNALHNEICEDELLQGIPSMEKTKIAFHAAKDCPEVRDRVFRLLKTLDFTYYCVVLRKKEGFFRRQFDFKKPEIYKYAVKHLLKDRLHLYSEIDCVFSAMGNVVRNATMQEAINSAKDTFDIKWNHENKNNIRVIIQQNSEDLLLQASDYVLWTIQRVYEQGEFRFYNFLKDKIKLVHDILDLKYYTSKSPLSKQKMNPL